jgi:hypothetical protein
MSARGRVEESATRRPVRVPRRVTLDLSDAFVDRLIELGHLWQADREDKNQCCWRSNGSSIRARLVKHNDDSLFEHARPLTTRTQMA